MMQCPNCRKRIKPGMTQCPRCGTPVNTNPQPSFQPNAQPVFPQNPQAGAQPYPQSNAKQKAAPRMENPGCLIVFLALLGISAASSAFRQDAPFSGAVTAETDAVYETTVAAFQETTAPFAETTLPAEQMTETTTVSMSEEDYLNLLRAVLSKLNTPDASVTNITLQNRVLTVTVNITGADAALSTAQDLTDEILSLDTTMWETVIVDFGAVGTVTKNKSEAISSAFGYYFDIPSLDY